MKYTLLLRRSAHLMEVLDDFDAEFYLANPETEFDDLQSAVRAARIEAAKADKPNYTHALRQQGINVVGSINILSDNYEIILALEGHHEVVWGWQPELVAFTF